MQSLRSLPIALLMVCCTLAMAADEPPLPEQLDQDAGIAADLQAMQGLWIREYKNPAGALFRVEKHVEGERDTVTHIDQNGNVIHSHRSEFLLERSGRVRLYTFSNSTAIAGPNIGAQRPGPESFVYRLQGETMLEVWGLLEGDRRTPSVLVWKREEKPAK